MAGLVSRWHTRGSGVHLGVVNTHHTVPLAVTTGHLKTIWYSADEVWAIPLQGKLVSCAGNDDGVPFSKLILGGRMLGGFLALGHCTTGGQCSL